MGPPPPAHPQHPRRPPPFLAVSHDEALARAKAENKPLLLFFDGHWSERAREVLPEIFSDPAVLAALNDHSLALRIDVLAAPDLTKRYKIFHVPTLVWLYPDGTARRYWVNCEKPSAIRTEIVESLTLLPKLRAATRPDDPLSRFKLARAFFDAGDYAAALTEARWLYLEAIGDTSSTKAKKEKDRVSAWDVIKFLEELRPFYEPARATTREFMEREEQKTRANPKSGIAAAKFWRLAKILGETHLIAPLHDSLPPGPARDTLARHLPKTK
ncbi:hypothetical protein CMV30_13850 [Nibricoccus aquaticus]|uniref:Uncharacterized protein n=1 Tax=Nibricoccus aquaticus TaxID=2576891 RepID=A0A290QKS8_9BACT|nr:DUF255 domain-containing protein [Nibricoccus aquaticus]ATC64961.1 hypothetical protein CMV30_13850 [Nibricoccus aquaticus]